MPHGQQFRFSFSNMSVSNFSSCEKSFSCYFWKTKTWASCSTHWLIDSPFTNQHWIPPFSFLCLSLPSLLLAPQHDQVAKLSDERITTPKKRKAPPPPISPLQVNACLSVYLSACVSMPPFILMHVYWIFLEWELSDLLCVVCDCFSVYYMWVFSHQFITEWNKIFTHAVYLFMY